MSTDLFRIIYCSRNILDRATSAASLTEILQVSRRNNGRQGVTGALLYNDGIFAQTLEGSFDAVQDVFERIQGDVRHGDVVVLEAAPVSHRIFGQWEMAYAQPHDPARANATLTTALIQPGPGTGADILALLGHVVGDQVPQPQLAHESV